MKTTTITKSRGATILAVHVLPSPLGPLAVALRPADGALVRLDFLDGDVDAFLAGLAAREAKGGRVVRHAARGAEVERQLREYFAGTRRAFDLPLAPVGTPFQRAVWAELVRIPFGTTATYGTVARRIGRARAGRAVGAANGSNPIAIVIPCHRVIGADGSLVGYSSGIERKRTLLELEGVLLPVTPRERLPVPAHTT